MRTLFEDRACQAVLDRIDRLGPERGALWGEMSAKDMVCHNTDVMRHALGEATAHAIPGPLAHRPLNWLLIHVLPWPKGKAESPPEFISRTTPDFAKELAHLRELVVEASKRGPDAAWPESPAFGRITGKDWGVLMYKHLDHHLRQFGV